MNQIMSIDGKHALCVGEWMHGSMPVDVAALRVIESAWEMDILFLHDDERAVLEAALKGQVLDDADLHILDIILMEAEKELELLAPDGWTIGYDSDGSFGVWRLVDGGEEPPSHGYEAYSSFRQDEVIW